MSISTADAGEAGTSRASLFYDPRIRGLVFQVVLAVAIAYLIYSGIANAARNLAQAGIASGFDFLGERSGFDIGQTLIPYSNASTYARAFFVGLTNTLLVSFIGIVLATLVGFIVGIARLSKNFLVRQAAAVFVETFRNIPLLLQLLFWYKAVLSVLPTPRASHAYLGETVFLNNRGLYLPRAIPEAGAGIVLAALVLAVVAAVAVAVWAKRRQMATGRQFATGRVNLSLILGLPLIAFLVTGAPFTLEYAALAGFSFEGGQRINPEFMALLLGLSIYTASFIAEIVRAGILAVSKGQTEAAFALGIRPNLTMRLIIIPQALRVIIPQIGRAHV